MGVVIGIGPLLLVMFGVDSAVPYYVCAAIVLASGIWHLASGCLALTLKAYDGQPPIPEEKRHGKRFIVIPVALCGTFFSEISEVSFLATYSLATSYLLARATLPIS